MIGTVSRVIQAICEHIAANDALAGRGVGVGVDESADGGVVVAGLEVVESGFLLRAIALMAKSGAFSG